VDIDGSENKIFDGDASMFPKITSLFRSSSSIFTRLNFFHATLPYRQGLSWDDDSDFDVSSDGSVTSEDEIDAETHLPIWEITSLSVAIQADDGIDADWVQQLAEMIEDRPALRFLELRQWSRTDTWVMEQCLGESGTWSATHLDLVECGPITGDVGCVLEKLENLQTLRITSQSIPGSKRYGMDTPISIQRAIDALEPVEANLMELEFDPGPSEHWLRYEPYPKAFTRQTMELYHSHAFTSFSKLQRLQVPLEMFSQSTGKMLRDENHTFYTNFPPSLENLTLVVTSRETFHQALEDRYALPSGQVVIEDHIVNISNLSCKPATYEKAHELFEELSQLADHKDLVPALRELHLLRDPCQWLDCEHVQQCTRHLEQAGIAVHIHDREIEGPTQSDYKRWVSQV
jgi:hypothetical protein